MFYSGGLAYLLFSDQLVSLMPDHFGAYLESKIPAVSSMYVPIAVSVPNLVEKWNAFLFTPTS